MKRTKALQPLSHQHHQGLFAAQRLRRATDETAVEAQEHFLAFWTAEGAHHFRVEEDVLLPAYARHAAPDAPEVVRVLTEHVAIRRFAAELSEGSASHGRLRELGELLHGHIRHEERTLFPLIEDAMDPQELSELAAAIEAARPQPPRRSRSSRSPSAR